MSSIFISINKSDTLEKSPIDKAIVRVAAALARQRSRLPPGPLSTSARPQARFIASTASQAAL